MSRSLGLTPDVVVYLRAMNPAEHPALAACRAETEAMGDIARMQISPEQGAFLGFLVRLIGVHRVLEVGVFTGYSALAMALAMGEGGKVVGLDLSRAYTDRARRHWDAAGVGARIDLRLGKAEETLAAMTAAGEAGFDLMFIDADKTGYDAYFEAGLKLVRPGGLIAFDNMLWGGDVADPAVRDADTLALRALAVRLREDPRVDTVLTSVGDGVSLVRVR